MQSKLIWAKIKQEKVKLDLKRLKVVNPLILFYNNDFLR